MTSTTLPKTLDFDGTAIEITDHDGAPWLTLLQIVTALGYETPAAVTNLYARNRAEFTPDMTALLRQGRTRVRIFSPRGAHLIGMFARTPKAKAFRRWVLDVLDRQTVGRNAEGGPALPAATAAQALPDPTLRNAPLVPADPITRGVRAAIERKAHALSLRHYDRLREDLTEAVRSHVTSFPEDPHLVRYVEQVDTPECSLVIVHSSDLWFVTSRMAAAASCTKAALEAIDALEQATGRSWYGKVHADGKEE